MFHHSIQLAVDLCGRQLLVDGAHYGSHAGLGALGHSGEQVGHEVGAAALPAGTGKHRGDGVLQPPVGIGGYHLHPAEPPSRQRAEEGQPKRVGPENSPPLLPNESARPSSSRESRHRQAFYLPWPTFVRGAGGAGLLGPGVCGLGGADTLNIECSWWQDCPCIVPPLVSSAYFRC